MTGDTARGWARNQERSVTFHCDPGPVGGEGLAVELDLTPVLTRILLLH